MKNLASITWQMLAVSVTRASELCMSKKAHWLILLLKYVLVGVSDVFGGCAL